MLKLIKNKKGQKEFWAADTWPFYLIFGIILNVVFIFFLMVTNSNAAADAEITEDLEEYIIYMGLLYSSDCFSYADDEIERAYKLDYAKFNEKSLNKCFDSNFALRFTLISEKEQVTIKSKKWNDEKSSKYGEPLKHVIVFKDNNFVKARLFVEIQ